MDQLPRLEDLDVRGRRVLVRVDFNVPLTPDARVGDDTRIRAALPTIQDLLRRGATLVLASHLGRPKGRPDPALSLRPVGGVLADRLGRPVRMLEACVGPAIADAIAGLAPGEVALLENLRFHGEEKAGEEGFARALAAPVEAFVLDAFGAAHRAHASITGVPRFLPSAAGLLLAREIEALSRLLDDPPRPFVLVLGGAKVSDKIGVVRNLLPRVDRVLVGGGMAYPFLAARGVSIGASRLAEADVPVARDLLAAFDERGVEVHLPTDHACGRTFAADTERVVHSGSIPDGWMGLDIGPATAGRFESVLTDAQSILWNGPVGVFEFPAFAEGTRRVVEAIVRRPEAVRVVGGGDSAAAVAALGFADRVGHVSTGGGAALEFLESGDLPGLAALRASAARGGR